MKITNIVLALAVMSLCSPICGAEVEKKEPEKLSQAGAKWRDELLRPISMEFEDIELKAMLDFGSGNYGLPMVYSTKSLTGAGLSIPYVNMRDITAGSFLELMTRECGLVCVPAKDSLWIGAAGETPEVSVGALAEPILTQTFGKPGAREALLEKLNQTCTIEFRDAHALDITRFLMDAYHVSIVIDPRVMSFPKCKPWPGVVSDGKIAGLFHQENANIRAVLTAMFRAEGVASTTWSPLQGLDFSVEEEYVWISTPEKLHKEARWYGK